MEFQESVEAETILLDTNFIVSADANPTLLQAGIDDGGISASVGVGLGGSANALGTGYGANAFGGD